MLRLILIQLNIYLQIEHIYISHYLEFYRNDLHKSMHGIYRYISLEERVGLTIYFDQRKHGKDQLVQHVRDHRQAVSNILAATLPFVIFKDMLPTSSICSTTATISTIKSFTK